jgi:hypothetical protein
VETRLIVSSDDHADPDDKSIRLIARSHKWIEQLSAGIVESVREIARREDLDEADVSRFLPLAFMAPDIVKTMISGRQPMELTADALRQACPLPYAWEIQRKLLGLYQH